jgi:hypothetical protein
MKTYKQLLENIGDSMSVVPTGLKKVGVQEGLDRFTKDHVIKFLEQLSSGMQPALPQLMAKVEVELAKFGYTLGRVDFQDWDLDDDGEDDFVIYERATKIMVENCYIALDWEKMTAATPVDYRPDGGKLFVSATFELKELGEGELKALLADMDNDPLDEPEFQDKQDHDDATDKSIHNQ